jgi:ubiquinone/menaquinone biosynthesis C-methylase UbiE
VSETERIRRIYGERALTYDQSIGVTERFALGPFRKAFGAHLRGETIEVGIGSGLNLPFYTAAVTRAVGVDLSPEMLALAQSRAEALALPIELLEGDAESLPFPDGSFDTAAVSLALCTIPDPVRGLRELARVCRPEGRVVMLEHVLSPLAPVALAERLLSPFQERTLGCHLDRETIDVARRLGFEIIEEQRRLFGVFRLVLARPPRPATVAMKAGHRGGPSRTFAT